MKIFNNVRGSMETVPNIHVGIDTVYVRTNITRIETDDFVGWQYDEIQYCKNEYIEVIAEENSLLKAENLNNMEAIASLYEIVSGGEM